jgi:hypothetical protein
MGTADLEPSMAVRKTKSTKKMMKLRRNGKTKQILKQSVSMNHAQNSNMKINKTEKIKI